MLAIRAGTRIASGSGLIQVPALCKVWSCTRSAFEPARHRGLVLSHTQTGYRPTVPNVPVRPHPVSYGTLGGEKQLTLGSKVLDIPTQKSKKKDLRTGSRDIEKRAALVRDAQAGNPEAFGQLYESTVDRVHRYIRFRVSEDAIALDLTQDAYLKALRSIASLKSAERFDSWLMQIAHRTLQNHYRTSSRHPVVAGESMPEREPGTGAQYDSAEALEDLDEVLIKKIVMQMTFESVQAAMAKLSIAQQDVIALRYIAGLSTAETSAACGRSEAATKKLQSRGLAALRSALAASEGDLQ